MASPPNYLRALCSRGGVLATPDSIPIGPQPLVKLGPPIPYIVSMPLNRKKKSARKRKTARVLSRKLVYKGPAFWVTSEQVLEPTGVRTLREIVRHTGSIVVLATQDQGKDPLILLERQYRHAAESFLWELPAGRIDEGESPLPAAKRELLEETGYTARHWKKIIRFFASPGFVAEPMTVFWARGLTPGQAQPEDDEVIEHRFVPLSKAVRMVLRGVIRDAKTICSVLWLAHHQSGKMSRK